MSNRLYRKKNESLESHFQNCKLFSESVEPLLRNRDSNMTQNEHGYAICCRPEIAGEVVSRENVKTLEDYVVLHSEVASF